MDPSRLIWCHQSNENLQFSVVRDFAIENMCVIYVECVVCPLIDCIRNALLRNPNVIIAEHEITINDGRMECILRLATQTNISAMQTYEDAMTEAFAELEDINNMCSKVK